MSVLMIFIDGVGLGDADPQRNPLAEVPMPVLHGLIGGPLVLEQARRLADGATYDNVPARLTAIDACLDVSGLPQSATGQTTLLSGVNASKVLGRHLSGLPTETLVGILKEHSLFKQLREAGRTATFANPFTEDYFAAVEAGRWRHSSSTTAVLSADLPVRMLNDFCNGEAVFHDVTGEGLRKRGYDVTPITAEEAGRRLAALAGRYDFTMFEHFLTDFAGHAQDWDEARRLLKLLDALVGAVLEHVDLDRTTVMVISDHGNLEDMSVKTHTRNPVPGLFIGKDQHELADAIRSLTDVTPVLVEHLTGSSGTADGGPRR